MRARLLAMAHTRVTGPARTPRPREDGSWMFGDPAPEWPAAAATPPAGTPPVDAS
jgi:hypothetical protein